MGGTFLISHSFALFETIILFSISTLVLPSNANIYEVAIFTDVNSAGFNHLTVHNDTGDVYVGGVNQVYRLNAGLELTASVTTGPEYGDDEVYDTFNKILKINYDDSELITCGGYQGVCQKRHIHDLSVTYENGDPIFVVANTTDETTVGYVAPNHLGKPMLYVGTTSTSVNPGRPLVSGRQLQGYHIFEVVEDGRGTTRVDVAPSYITTFPVSYVAGFSYNGYSYFVTTQQSSTSGSEYISKLVRVCQRAEQQYFNSYTEVTLKCQDDSYNLAQAVYLTVPGQDLNQLLALDDDEAEEVLFVSFAVGAYNPPTPAKQSAICMYKMSTIKRAFQDAVEGCMESEGLPAYSASWMQGATCVGWLPFDRGVHECHALTLYRYANGMDDQYGYAVEDYSDTLVTSIAVTTVEQHTVGFLGTDTGRVLKVHFINSSYANTYEIIDFEDTRKVLPDTMFDSTEKHFYRLSSSSVCKTKVEDCSQFITCMRCLRSMDPYCGWCMFGSRCSTNTSCQDSHPSSRWLHHFNDDNECVGMAIESIDPEDSIPINVVHPVTLNIEVLDDDNGRHYTCNYNGYSTVAERHEKRLTCDTPPLKYRSHIPNDKDHITEVLIASNITTLGDYAETDFHYYNCSVHKSCTGCVTSDWACNWCVYENRCTHYLDMCQRDDSSSVVVGTNNKFNDTGIKGQAFCPQLDVQYEEVLIPVNVDREIQLTTVNMYENKDLGEYECVLMIEDKPQTTEATRHDETSVTCNMRKYTYESVKPEMYANLTLRWNYGLNLIDDIHGCTVTLYNCSVDRYDRTECLADATATQALSCGWCRCTNTCEYVDHCEPTCFDTGGSSSVMFFNLTWTFLVFLMLGQLWMCY